jgi:opacity protein-like surface antigen
LRGSYIREFQRLDASFPNALSANPTNELNSLRLQASLAYGGDNRFVFTGQYFDIWGFEGLDERSGWTAGAGLECAFYRNWSASVEYDYYQFGHGTVLMTDSINAFSGPVDAKQSLQVVKAGLNFHMRWSGR